MFDYASILFVPHGFTTEGREKLGFGLKKGDSIKAGKQRSDGAVDCAPCADFNMTVKEQMAKLDNME
jgi:hypothetical protein